MPGLGPDHPGQDHGRSHDVAAPAHGIARKTDNLYAGVEFFEALMELVQQGTVEVIPTTGLTGHDWYRLADGVK